MQKVLFWVRSRAGMTPDEFRKYWLETHAPLAKASFAGLRGYEINIVTGTLEGEPFVNGLAELRWDSREAFLRDVSSPAGKRVFDDVANFASEGGPLMADEVISEPRSGQLSMRVRRFFRTVWAEMGRIPEYHDQADRLRRMLRRNRRQ